MTTFGRNIESARLFLTMLNRANGASQALSQSDSDPYTSSAEDAEYVALETTLRSSELGRRFLADYARQHPTPEVKLLLDAVSRLEAASADAERHHDTHGLVSELVAMSETISDMRREIGALCAAEAPDSDPMTAPCAFEQILNASTRATSDVLQALEEIQNVSAALRNQGVDADYCDRLDESAVDIYTACARREMAGQQTADAFNLLRDLEHRIDALIEDWSDHEVKNLMVAAKALDLSEAFETAPAQTYGADESAQARDKAPQKRYVEAQEPVLQRTNRLVPQEKISSPASPESETADKPVPAEPPAIPEPVFDGRQPFEHPAPMTLEALVANQRAALFG
jgi:hypothetical protein